MAHSGLKLSSATATATATWPAPAATPQCIAFLLLPNCSLLSLGSALDALAHANAASDARNGPRLYEALLVSADGRPVPTNAATVQVDLALHHLPVVDGLFVLSDTPIPQRGHEEVVAYLQQLGAGPGLLGGIGTGAWLLARAGLLAARRATVHWSCVPLFAASFPEVVVSSNVFESDRQCLTCAGGHATFDMMLHRIGQSHGSDIVGHMLGHASLERARGPKEPQRVPLTSRLGGGQPKLKEAVALMESNIEEPLATEDIAQLVGVSRRQLERLFKQHLDSLPSRYYTELRLNRARQLLQQSSQSILQVGLGCGFSSGGHFSSAYRAHFGVTPREQRRHPLGLQAENGRGSAPHLQGEFA